MTKLVALCRITRKHPGAAATEVTGYDKNGDAIVKVKSETLLPGDLFEAVDDDQEREFLRLDAKEYGDFAPQFAYARRATEAELALFERQPR